MTQLSSDLQFSSARGKMKPQDGMAFFPNCPYEAMKFWEEIQGRKVLQAAA